MKRTFVLFIFLAVGLVIISGCSMVERSTSSVLRTAGLGEEALPLEAHHFAIETSVQTMRFLDKIYYTEYEWVYDPENLDVVAEGRNLSGSISVMDAKLRLSLSARDELSLGFLSGKEGGETTTSSSTVNGVTTEREFTCQTSYTGFKVGYKRLLSDWESPTKVSMFVSLASISFASSGKASMYDAKSWETKAAILIGQHSNLEKRTSYPTISFYHASAHTNRDKTVVGISKEKHPQTFGAELLYTIDFGFIYSALNAGVENQFTYTGGEDGLNYHLGFKIGIKPSTRKQ